MKTLASTLLLFILNLGMAQNLLVFSKTNGYRHTSIEDGQKALAGLAARNGMTVQFSEDSLVFSEETLSQVDVVIFLNTTGNLFAPAQKEAIQAFINQGGGFLGIHSASDTEYQWPWYGKLVGNNFAGHPEIQQADLSITDSTHLATVGLPTKWVRKDEWYNFNTPFPEHLNVLITIDESSYEGGKMDGYHPLSWYHEYDGGRAFYTALGHTAESYIDPLFLGHLLGAIQWAAGQ